MKYIFFFLPLILTTLFAQSQTSGAMYRVEFTDKNNSPYSIGNPQEFLTQRAIDRRTRMDIPINQSDIPVVQNYLNGIAAKGAVIHNCSRWFNSATVFVSDTSVIPSIQALSYVAAVVKIKPYLEIRKNKPFKEGTQYTFENPGQGSDNKVQQSILLEKAPIIDYGHGFNQANMIGADYLHRLGYKGDHMVIAILDAGFYHVNTLSMFDSLRNDGRLLGYKDFVLPGNNLFEESNHGMAVASTIVGNVPGTLVGTAPHSSVWLLRSEDASSEYIVEEDNWIAAAEFADSVGADVINSSLGYTDFDDDSQSHTYAMMDGNTTRITRGADIAASKGILIVNSAGNSGNDSWHYIGAPADADSIITVGAVDKAGNFASFSSFGPSSDQQIKPTVCAQGEGPYVVSTSDGVYPSNGTSFSSPIMAGAVTCLWQANPTLSNMEIIDMVKQSGSHFTKPDSMFGYGIPSMVIAHMLASGNQFVRPDSGNLLMANPNPFNAEIDVVVLSESSMVVQLSMVNNSGKIHWSADNYQLKPGYNYLLISNLAKLSSGLYFLRVQSDVWSDTIKLLKN